MGGVPLLLVAVAMGITYGWQPDGHGGVDYIIQIPPEQIDQVRRSGTISSVVDPAVRGHVSRVIVKFGNEPLARNTPKELVQTRESLVMASSHTSASDHQPVPIPELDPRSPQSRAMKPDANDPGRGPGMALPPSLSGGAVRAADAAAQAGNQLRDAMSELSADLAQRTRNDFNANPPPMNEAMRGALPPQDHSRDPRLLNQNSGNVASGGGMDAARGAMGAAPNAAGQNDSNFNRQIPPFTGQSDDNVARIRSGGPTTAPANSRDKKWFDMSTAAGGRVPSTDPVSNRAAWPELAGPPDLRAGQPQSSNAQNPASSRGSLSGATQPLGSTATFARIPNGMSLPNSNPSASANTQPMAISDYQRAQYERQLQQQAAEQNSAGYLDFPNREPAFGGSIATASDNGGIDFAYPNSPSSGSGPGYGESSQANAAANQQAFDPRLSRADIARLPYGAWSMDAYGNPIDREGRILDPYGRPVSQQRAFELTRGGLARGPAGSSVSLDRPIRNSFDRPESGTAQSGLPSRPALDPPMDRLEQERIATLAANNSRAVASASDRLQSHPANELPRDYSSANTLTKNRRTFAAQPIFNGLLLLSIIANFYLIHNLNNLRIRFRDLVAAKRASASEIAA